MIRSWTLPSQEDTHGALQKTAEEQAQRIVTDTWSGVTRQVAGNLQYEEEGSEVDPESDDPRITGSSSDSSQADSTDSSAPSLEPLSDMAKNIEK